MSDNKKKDIDVKVTIEVTGEDEPTLREKVKSVSKATWILSGLLSLSLRMLGSESLYIYVLIISVLAYFVYELSKDFRRDF